MTRMTEAYEVIDKLTASLATLDSASRLLWDVRIIMESPEFKDEVFWEFKELETKIWEDIEKIREFKGRMTV
jgi:hypothetical protein